MSEDYYIYKRHYKLKNGESRVCDVKVKSRSRGMRIRLREDEIELIAADIKELIKINKYIKPKQILSKLEPKYKRLTPYGVKKVLSILDKDSQNI